jgi:AsmA protein
MRKILITLGVLVVLVIALGAAVPFLIPTKVYEDKIVAAVKLATGRDLKIEGPVSLHVLTGFSLTAEKVSLANAPGSPEAEMTTLAKLDIGLKLVPLMSGDIEITHLVLTDPVIHLDIDKAGKGNWVFEPGKAATPVAAEAKTSNASDTLKQLHLGEVKIVDGTLTYADARGGKPEQLDKVDLTLNLPSLDQKMSLTGNATWHKQALTLSLDVDKPEALMAGTPSHVSLKLSGSPLKMDFDGDVATKPALKVNGSFAASGPSLRDVAAWAGSPVKAGGTGLGTFDIKGNLALEGETASVTGLDVALDAINGGGELIIGFGGARPSLKGGITLGDLDLNPYLPHEAAASHENAPVAAPVAPGGGWSDAPIDLSALKSADVQMAVTIASLKFEKIEIGKSVSAIVLQNGRLNLAFKQITLYGGSGTAEIAIDGSEPAMGLNATMALNNIQIQPALEAVLGLDRLSGTATMDLTIASHGRSQHELVAGLSGHGTAHVANGAIKGVDFASLAKNLQSLTSKGSAGASATDQTAFTTLGGSFTIANGVMSNSDLAASSPLFTMTGKGTIDLLHRTMDYTVTPSLASNLQGGKSGIMGATVPILVQGPWANLSYRPDVQGLLQQRLAKAKLPGAVQNLLGGSQGAGSSSSASNLKPADILKSFLGK